MTTGVVTPDEKTFLELARTHRVVPVTRRLLADGETPVGVYRKLAGGPGTFLLESAEHGAASGGHGVVAVLVRRRAQHRHADRAGRSGASGSAPRRPACRPTGDPVERAAGDGRGC